MRNGPAQINAVNAAYQVPVLVENSASGSVKLSV